MLAKISANTASLAVLLFERTFGFTSHITLDKFIYNRPPAVNNIPFIGPALSYIFSKKRSKKSSIQLRPIGEMGALSVIPLDSEASTYSLRRNTLVPMSIFHSIPQQLRCHSHFSKLNDNICTDTSEIDCSDFISSDMMCPPLFIYTQLNQRLPAELGV